MDSVLLNIKNHYCDFCQAHRPYWELTWGYSQGRNQFFRTTEEAHDDLIKKLEMLDAYQEGKKVENVEVGVEKVHCYQCGVDEWKWDVRITEVTVFHFVSRCGFKTKRQASSNLSSFFKEIDRAYETYMTQEGG